MRRYSQYVWFLLFVRTVFCQHRALVRVSDVCVTTGGLNETDHCYQFRDGNLTHHSDYYTCIQSDDAIGCATKIKSGQLDYAIFTPEAALVANEHLGDDVWATLQYRKSNFSTQSNESMMVMIVRRGLNIEEITRRKINVCFPGFTRTDTTKSRRVLNGIERFLLLINNQQPPLNLTSVHHELNSVLPFLNDTCRPGRWAYDPTYDAELKAMPQFSRFCQLCENKADCTYRDDTYGPLRCLTQMGRDIAFADFRTVQQYFGLVAGSTAQASPSGYEMFCPSHTTVNLTQGVPACSWTTQPWGVFVEAKFPQKELPRNLEQISPRPDSFIRGLENKFTFTLMTNSRTANTTLSSYLEKARQDMEKWKDEKFTRTMTLCTINEKELQKCQLLGAATQAADIRPRLDCVEAPNKNKCIQNVKDGSADFVGITYASEYADKLEPVVRQYKEVIVGIKRKRNQRLQAATYFPPTPGSHTACFPEYNGTAWNAFLNAGKKRKQLQAICPHSMAISKYFVDVCAPGAKKDLLYNDMTNLCKACAGNCAADKSNKYYGDLGAFRCLLEGHADYAYVNFPNVLATAQNEGLSITDLNLHDFGIECSDGKMIELVDYKTMNEKCILSVGSSGQFITRKTREEAEKRDIEELISGLHYVFEEKPMYRDAAVRLYKPMGDTKGLIFESTTVDVIPERVHSARKIPDYDSEVLAFSKSCVGEHPVTPSPPITFPVTTAKPSSSTKSTTPSVVTTTETSDGSSIKRRNMIINVFILISPVILFYQV